MKPNLAEEAKQAVDSIEANGKDWDQGLELLQQIAQNFSSNVKQTVETGHSKFDLGDRIGHLVRYEFEASNYPVPMEALLNLTQRLYAESYKNEDLSFLASVANKAVLLKSAQLLTGIDDLVGHTVVKSLQYLQDDEPLDAETIAKVTGLIDDFVVKVNGLKLGDYRRYVLKAEIVHFFSD